MLGSFLGPEFVTKGRSAIFSGPTGRGKTHLAVALAYRAVQNGFDARFTTADELRVRVNACDETEGTAGVSQREVETSFRLVLADPFASLGSYQPRVVHDADYRIRMKIEDREEGGERSWHGPR